MTQALSKKTLVIGASTNPSRYSNLAVHKLLAHGHQVVALGPRPGWIGHHPIVTKFPDVEDEIDTVTLYIGPERQQSFYDKVVGLHPQRVIFNPGTENSEFYQKLDDAGIPYFQACTLVMLSTGAY